MSLADDLKAIVTDDYVFFLKGPLSQWVKSPFYQNDTKFTCCEQYMMWRKAKLFGDNATAHSIYLAKTPKEQKDLGRQVQGFNEAVWAQHRENIVFLGNFFKYSQLTDYRELLLATGTRTLVEVNPRDKIWGIGLADTDPLIHFPEQWPGMNLLGKTLMRVRDVLVNIKDTYVDQ